VAVVDTRLAFVALVGLVAVERLVEVVISRRNAARSLARGGIEVESRAFYAAMVAFHALFLIAAPAEVLLARRPFRPGLAVASLVALAGAMALRYWAIASLGDRWNTRVIVVPGEAAVAAGPYRHLRHPNYLAVVVEMLALPLVHGAWLTAALASCGNAWLLSARIRREERALAEASDYEARLAGRGRLLPVRR